MAQGNLPSEVFQKYGLPWILYALGSWLGYPAGGCAAALVLLVGLGLSAPSRLKAVEVVLAIYFLLSGALFCGLALPGLARSQTGLAPALLGLMAFGSILLRQPFTLAFAREEAPREMWENPHFYRVNYLLTLVWGLAFFVCAGLKYWAPLPGVAVVALCFLLLFFVTLFTKWFPEWYRQTLGLKSEVS